MSACATACVRIEVPLSLRTTPDRGACRASRRRAAGAGRVAAGAGRCPPADRCRTRDGACFGPAIRSARRGRRSSASGPRRLSIAARAARDDCRSLGAAPVAGRGAPAAAFARPPGAIDNSDASATARRAVTGPSAEAGDAHAPAGEHQPAAAHPAPSPALHQEAARPPVAAKAPSPPGEHAAPPAHDRPEEARKSAPPAASKDTHEHSSGKQNEDPAAAERR